MDTYSKKFVLDTLYKLLDDAEICSMMSRSHDDILVSNAKQDTLNSLINFFERVEDSTFDRSAVAVRKNMSKNECKASCYYPDIYFTYLIDGTIVDNDSGLVVARWFDSPES